MTSQAVSYAAAGILLLSLSTLVSSRPQSYPLVVEPLEDECSLSDQLLTTCQTCAKETRSRDVYPLCCAGREDARSFCERYLAFGKEQKLLLSS